jgi:sec-independent protein translocase protein TatA
VIRAGPKGGDGPGENRFPSLQALPPAYVSPAMASSSAFFAVFGLGPTELIVILVILLVLFGGSKLPSLAKGLGQSVKEFKKATKEEEEAAAAKATTVTEVKKTEVTPTKGTT